MGVTDIMITRHNGMITTSSSVNRKPLTRIWKPNSSQDLKRVMTCSPLVNPRTGQPLGDLVGEEDQCQTDHAFEQTDGCCQAKLKFQNALPIDPGIDDV